MQDVYFSLHTVITAAYTLHNGNWKKMKRKISLQIKIRQIVKINDEHNK